jgi:hypothetical protein
VFSATINNSSLSLQNASECTFSACASVVILLI